MLLRVGIRRIYSDSEMNEEGDSKNNRGHCFHKDHIDSFLQTDKIMIQLIELQTSLSCSILENLCTKSSQRTYMF